MSCTTVTVSVRLQAIQGHDKRVRNALLALTAATRPEAGCLQYDPHQSPDDPREFLLVERWSDQEHLDAHTRQPHLAVFRESIADCLARSPEAQVWDELAPVRR